MIWDSDGTEPIDGGHILVSICAGQDTKHARMFIWDTGFLESELSQLRKCALRWLKTLSLGKKRSAACSKFNNSVKESDHISTYPLHDNDLISIQVDAFLFLEILLVPVNWVLEVPLIVVRGAPCETSLHVFMETFFTVI